MTAARTGYFIHFASVRNFVFFTAVIAMNYTLLRPSPVDLLFCTAGFLCLFVNQRLGVKFLLLVVLLLGRTWSFIYPSLPFADDPGVRFEILAHIFVVLICLVSCYIAQSWDSRDFNRFIRVYVAAATLAATLAMTGFILKIPFLTWDGRGAGFFDDPNMYGSFVVPSVLCCIYMIANNLGRRPVWVGFAIYLTLGVLFSFSRAATVGLLLTATGYLAFLGRTNVRRLLPMMIIALAAGAIIFTAAYFVAADLAPEMLSRLTVAKEYDRGEFGRYGRYFLSIPMILDNPVGLGLLQQEKIFPEPIHNIFLSSFLNYGWLGGFVWLTLFLSSLVVGYANYRFTRNPLAVLLTLCFLAPIMCAFLHEGEHWRHMWMFIGLQWGFAIRNFRPLPIREERAVPPLVPYFVAAGLPRARPAQ